MKDEQNRKKGAGEVSRRDFLKRSALSAGAAATVIGTGATALAGTQPKSHDSHSVESIQTALKKLGDRYDPGPVDGVFGSRTQAAVKLFQTDQGLRADGLAGPQTCKRLFPSDPSINLAPEFEKTRYEAAKPANFPMTGGQVFAKFCSDEGLKGLFCCPGNYAIINALATEGITCYGGRTEGSMCSAADGFARVTGEVAATSGTEGPGFTNMIMNIGAANAAHTPVLVLASNMTVAGDDTEGGIQRGYQQPTTEGLRKYGKRLITPNRVYEYAAYAFRQLKTGVPGPVHLDFPGEVARARFNEPGDLKYYFEQSKYRSETKPAPSPKSLAQAADLVKKSERPIIVASMGVFYDRAWDSLRALAEKNDIAVVESGSSRGHFGDGHRLSASTAPDSLMSADLVIFVGQYCMPPVGEYAFNAEVKTIRVHPVPEELGRNWPVDLGIVSGANEFFDALAAALPKRSRDSWTSEIAAARKAFEEENDKYYKLGLKHSAETGVIHPACIARGVSDFLYHGDLPKEQTTVISGGYGIGRYTRRYLRAFRPGQICNGAYQYGAIGPDVGYTIGVGAAVQEGVGPQKPYKGAPVITVTGDAGFAYSGMEIETLSKYRIPAVIIVYNNNAWGVWNTGRSREDRRGVTKRAQHMYLFQEHVRYDRVAEGLGARGEYVTAPDQFGPALKRSYEIAAADGISTVINCQAMKEFWTNKYPPGMLRKVEPGAMSYAH